ncbi:MAG: 3-methyl-2-oxobutanoate dehydrogenase subunit VorB [Chloroflexota bacterium]|nr:MAG: 3-methyl-2-oxobutanoate dehydrogenase subunit VorB [Chloroflexota bacterium]
MQEVKAREAEKVLMKGTEAIGAAALLAGCRCYFGYPITPQNEVGEYLSQELPKVGGVFVQAESETAAANMVYGAAGAGQRVMTSTAGPGYTLMLEGISALAATELPAVILLVMRKGPGGGGIDTAQTDYTSATRGGGHGGYHTLVFAPWSCQELFDLTQLSFYLADKYRNPVIVLADGTLAQMMESVEPRPLHFPEPLPPKTWAITGHDNLRPKNVIVDGTMTREAGEALHVHLQAKYAQMAREEQRYEVRALDDAEIVVFAFGTVARVAWTAAQRARREGVRVGLVRPISVYPFPYDVVEAAAGGRKVFVAEGNMGQMLEDVRLAVGRKAEIGFVGQPAELMSPTRIYEGIMRLAEGR